MQATWLGQAHAAYNKKHGAYLDGIANNGIVE